MALNLNKLFPFLSIRSKLIIAFSLLSFVPLTVVGVISVYYNFHGMKEVALDNLTHDVALFNERAQRFLESARVDMTYLGSSVTFRDFQEKQLGADSAEIALARRALTNQLVSFARSKRIYYRFRVVDRDGEQVRIWRESGAYTAASQDELDDAKFRFYFVATEDLERGQMAILPVELMSPEGGTMAAISIVLRTYDASGGFTGILIGDIFATSFFNATESGIPLSPNRVMAIVTDEGYYVYHSEKKTNWNMLLAGRDTHNLFADFLGETVRSVLSGSEGIVWGVERIVAYAPLFRPAFHGGSSYYIVGAADKAFILKSADRYAQVLAGLLLGFLAISVLLGYVATTQFAGPIRKLQEGANIVAQGNYAHLLKIETNDEIEELANQFNHMAQAVSEREHLLAQQQRSLEEKVRMRTQQLKGEKEKLQAVLDNVPSAFILLDGKRRILSASAAIKSITGIEPEDAVGKPGRDILPNAGFDRTAKTLDLNSTDATTYSTAAVTGADGTRRLVERTQIPLVLDGTHRATLEVLTDITDRKNMEMQMLRAEKLAATGEMAAIIAHEIRNSLTSVKMILQLQREACKGGDEEQSLEVALGSVLRAEEVVNNLLRFARPHELELQGSDINDIIKEGLLFVRPTFAKRDIEIIERLGVEIPIVSVDRQQLKEAIVNILINAAQAIEEPGRIEVRSGVIRLAEAAKDGGFSAGGVPDVGRSRDRVRFDAGDRVIEILIRDNGIGIDADEVDKIFDPFYTTKAEGTGLGLTMVRRTVHQHAGIVSVANSKDGGAVFRIMLPTEKTS